MKTPLVRRGLPKLAGWLVAGLVSGPAPAATFSEWQQRQPVEVPAPGLVQVALPPATLDALRPGLEDLRLADPTGAEMPFLIQRPAPEPAPVHNPKSFKAALRGVATVLEIETGLGVPMNAVTLETADRDWIKAVRLEGSRDGQRFIVIADGIPLFRQGGVSDLTVRFPAATWAWLRLTVDDQRSAPAAFTGARLHAAEAVDAPVEPAIVTVKSREELEGDTRLLLDLGAANLTLATIEIDTPEVLFQREITLRVPELVGDEIHESDLARGFIYARDLANVTRARKTSLPVDRQVRSRELILLIRNFDSPPLDFSAVRAWRRPVYLLFQSRQPGAHFLYSGNSQCPTPHYDLGPLAGELKRAQRATLATGTLAPNPDYRAGEALPGLGETGAPLDTRPWRYRKALRLVEPGPQQVELDLDGLAGARPDLADLRLVRESNQVPYLVERTSLTRQLSPAVTGADDPKRPRVSRWRIALPRPALPLTRLECRARTTLFERSLRLWEEVPDGRGGRVRVELGGAEWRRTADSKETPLFIALTRAPKSGTLFLETDNGDNPAIELERFRLAHAVTRLVFKATSPPMLYYGNPSALAPRYDLRLVATKLLSAERSVAALGAEERLKPGARTEGEPLSGARGWLFWGILGLVVAGLMAVIVRLLPKPKAADAGSSGPG